MAKSKNKIRQNNKEYKKSKRLLTGTLCCAAGLFIAYSLISADNTGAVGKMISNVLLELFGSASFMLPFILFWFATVYFVTSSILRTRIDTVLAVSSLTLFAVLCEIIKDTFTFNIFSYGGGWTGAVLAPLFTGYFGSLSGLIVFAALITVLSYFFRISLFGIIGYFIKGIFDDIKQWYEYKKALKQVQPKILQQNKAKKDTENINNEKDFFKQSEEPNIINGRNNKKSKEKFEEKIKEPKQYSAAVTEEREKTENTKEYPVQQEIPQKIDTKKFKYILPPVKLLREGGLNNQINEDELRNRAENLRQTLKDFKIDAVVQDIIPGPVITRYDIVLAPGIKIQSVMNIMDNISLAMKTAAIRIEPIPEKSAVGIEIPNPKASLVSLRDILDTEDFHKSKSLLTLAVGTQTDGSGYISNLAKMPHLLIAGSTGSGKSVGVHNIILSILYKARPDEVKFMLIDPKRVEMTAYKEIPHLYNPCCTADDADVITKPDEASEALKKLVKVMEERYEKYAFNMVRNIEDYNNKMIATGGDKDYYIVVIIDELADLMMVASKEIEDSIQRLAQMARAVGIHLILATQRPSVSVITGNIKTNFPARMSFQTVSAIDSKVILDSIGAENLIGKGDMLFLDTGASRPVRLQGAFVSSKEIEQIVQFITEQDFPKFYEPLTNFASANAAQTPADKAEKDLIPALRLIMERRRVSQDLLKANFGGSARATNILSFLEVRGFIHKPEGTNKWEINFNLIEDYLRING